MKKRFTESVVVLAVLVGVGLLWLPMLSSDVKPWEQGREVPTTPPAEARRIYRSGFSFIAPPRWEPREEEPATQELHLTLRPRKSIPSRTSILIVSNLGERPPKATDVQPTVFQGKPALFTIESKRGAFDDPPSFGYALYFQRGAVWYTLQFSAQIKANELPESVMRYFNTFRIENTPSSKSARRPTDAAPAVGDTPSR